MLVVVPPVVIDDDSFVPRNQRPKSIPKHAAKPAPKGKHVQLFQIRHQVGKGFYSTSPDALMPLVVQSMLKFCLHIVFWCLVATIVLWVRYGQVFATCILLVPRIARKPGLVQARDPF